MQTITLKNVSLRRSPGFKDKPADDILHTLPEGTLMMLTGAVQERDGLVWNQVVHLDVRGWVAECSSDSTPLTCVVGDDEGDFDDAFRFILRHEGGYSNYPEDPGGETKFGISKRAYPNLDISSLKLHEAKEIYRRDYWNASGADELPFPLNVAHFDTAVNCGIAKANQFRAVCQGRADFYLTLRREFYRGLSSFGTFGTGWMRRVDELEKVVRGDLK